MQRREREEEEIETKKVWYRIEQIDGGYAPPHQSSVHQLSGASTVADCKDDEERTVHQIVDAPMPRHAEEIVEVGQIILQENITKSRQIVLVLDPQKLNGSTLGVLVDERREDILQFLQNPSPEHATERNDGQIVDCPVLHIHHSLEHVGLSSVRCSRQCFECVQRHSACVQQEMVILPLKFELSAGFG